MTTTTINTEARGPVAVTSATSTTTPSAPAVSVTAVTTPAPAPHGRSAFRNRVERAALNVATKDTSYLKLNVSALGAFEVSANLTIGALTPENDTDSYRRTRSGVIFNQVTFDARAAVGVAALNASKLISSRAILPTNVAVEDATFGKIFQALKDNAAGLRSGLSLPFHADAPFTPESIRAMPAGAEFSVSFTDEVQAGAAVGTTASAGVITTSVSAGIVAAATKEYARSVYRLPDGRAYFEVGERKSTSVAIGAQATAQFDLDLPLHAPIERALNHKAAVGASISAEASRSRPLNLGATFDPSHERQMRLAQEIITAKPSELAERQDELFKAMASAGMGFDWAANERARALHAAISFGTTDVLSYSSVSRSTKGTLRISDRDASGKVTTYEMAESEYQRHVGGKLPMFLLKKTGDFEVRGNRIVKNGVETFGAGMAMRIDVNEVTPGMVARIRNLLTDLGVPTDVTGESAIGGKGELDIEFSMSKPFFDKLESFGSGARRASAIAQMFDKNYREFHGEDAPWLNDKVIPDGYPFGKPTTVAYQFATQSTQLTLLDQAGGGGAGNERQHIIDSYRIATQGRDLVADMRSFETRNTVATEMGKATGDASQWGPIVEAVGKADQADFLVLALATAELGGDLVNLEAKANGVNLRAKPVGQRNVRIGETRGVLTDKHAL